jgi:hypothetical protein
MKYNLFICESLCGKYGMCVINNIWKSFDSYKERENYIEEMKNYYDIFCDRVHEVKENVDIVYYSADKEV